MVEVGKPLTSPTPPRPVYASVETLVPHWTPVTVNVDVAVTVVSDVGWNPATAATVLLPLTVTLVFARLSENCDALGAPKATLTGALPTLRRVTPMGSSSWLFGAS